MGICGDITVGVPNQNEIAVTLEFVSGIGDDAVLRRLDGRAFGHRQIDAVVRLAVGLGAVGRDHLAAHRPAERRQRAGGFTGLDGRSLGCGRFFHLRGGRCESRALRLRPKGNRSGDRRRQCTGLGSGNHDRLGRLSRRGGLYAGHGQSLAELELRRGVEAVGPGELRGGYFVAARDAEQGIAAIDDVNRRCRRCRNGLAGRRRQGRCRRSGHGLTRNDQLLAGRQRARSLVAIGLQDRGGRNVIAARQRIQRVAGADDDRGAGLRRSMGGRADRRDRARGDGGRGLQRLVRRGRI